MSKLILFFLLVLWCCKPSEELIKEELTFVSSIPLAGNAWFSKPSPDGQDKFGLQGLKNWSENEVWIFFHTSELGDISLGLSAKVQQGASELAVTLNGEEELIRLDNLEAEVIPVGVFKISKPGYQKVIVKGISKAGSFFADIDSLHLGGKAGDPSVLHYVKDDFYWGRRGPSVHFSYGMPADSEVKWLYNEITVPKDNDVLGSYFMANGFAEGYFGIQVNSPSERRILFSVWSPYTTDDPKTIPDDQKIILLKKGAGVNTGEFGNEGSGGQSFKRFNWKAGLTYRFLTKIEPSSVSGSTDYTSYFYDSENGNWELIASFRRPKTSTYAKRFHSFLENFIPGTGHISRGVDFSNQWVYTTQGEWIELVEAKYTADATARKGNRLDYLGAVSDQNTFYLKNCGFFSPNVGFDVSFKREKTGIVPQVNLTEIEKL